MKRKHYKRGAKVGAMVRWRGMDQVLYYGIITRLPCNENLFSYYNVREIKSHQLLSLKKEDFTIHKA